jgi:hypothetical protein
MNHRAVLGDDAIDEMEVASDTAELVQDPTGDKDDGAMASRTRGSRRSPSAMVPS